MRYARVIAEIAATPLAIMPEKLDAVMAFISDQANGIKYSADEIQARTGGPKPKPRRKIKGGVAVIPVMGLISQRLSLMDEISETGASTEQIGTMIKQAWSSEDVGAIVLLIHSPGGTVFGVPELGALIAGYAAQGTKPIIAQVSSLAASAAYWIASQANEIVVTPSGEVGSIGVYRLHQDVSRAADEAGITFTFISAGKYKVEGNSYEPLSDEARDFHQRRVNECYDDFVSAVARGRGVKPADVRSGFAEGRCVGAKEAVRLGMADRIGTLDDTLQRLGVALPAGGAKAWLDDDGMTAEDEAPETDANADPLPTDECQADGHTAEDAAALEAESDAPAEAGADAPEETAAAPNDDQATARLRSRSLRLAASAGI